MKKIMFIIMLMISVNIAFAQEFTHSSKTCFTDTITTYSYKIDNTSYKVYVGKSGAYYIWKTSKKSGKPYKMYLPKEVQIKMGRKYKE